MVKSRKQSQLKEYTFFIKGMHCASCELLIERRLLKEKGIEAVEASTNKGEARIVYFGQKLSLKKINRIFQKSNYIFSDKKIEVQENIPTFRLNRRGQLVINKEKFFRSLSIVGISLLVILGFLALQKSGLAALISINSQSALPAFLIFGLLAGFSTCSALVGGIILSMSKQWSDLYPDQNSTSQKFQPHFLFNAGRLVSYGFFGALLGVVGSALQISLTFTSTLAIAVSILMILLALQMLGVKRLRKFQFTVPKFITRFVADEKNFKGRWMPFLMGAFTFFLPCGFTITVQGLALISGNPLQAGLMTLFFALGTLPALLMISVSSVKLGQKPHFAGQFLKIAGVLVLFFALFNINSQLNVLGFKSFSDLSFNQKIASKNGLPPVIAGKQILKMEALAFGYEPNNLKVEAGVPVRWEITDKGTSGCTNAIVSRGLFDGEINLTPGTVSIKEFTPQKPGKYKFSCWMGMVSGVIEVVGFSADSGQILDNPESDIGQVIDSGVQGCGGNGDSGCGGGCGGGCGNSGCSYAR